MKECPNCKKHFTDDLFFCLYDGVPLKEVAPGVDASVATEAYGGGPAAVTEVIRSPPSDPTISSAVPGPWVDATPRSALPYFAVGALALVCIALIAVIAMNLDRIFPAVSPERNKGANDLKVTPTALSSPSVSASPRELVMTTANANTRSPATTYDPTGTWKGEWSTSSGTLLDIEISLTEAPANGLDGHIKWTLRKTVRPDKMDKIGLSAIEYVRGTFDPATGAVVVNGFRKDDPNGVLVMVDDYKLTVSRDGKSLTGLARNGGKWNGRLRLARY